MAKEKSFTEGPVTYSLVMFALPVLGALILQAAYGAVDLLVVGRFGDASSISGGRHGERLYADGDVRDYEPRDGYNCRSSAITSAKGGAIWRATRSARRSCFSPCSASL